MASTARVAVPEPLGCGRTSGTLTSPVTVVVRTMPVGGDDSVAPKPPIRSLNDYEKALATSSEQTLQTIF
jgi:hypothetical protein